MPWPRIKLAMLAWEYLRDWNISLHHMWLYVLMSDFLYFEPFCCLYVCTHIDVCFMDFSAMFIWWLNVNGVSFLCVEELYHFITLSYHQLRKLVVFWRCEEIFPVFSFWCLKWILVVCLELKLAVNFYTFKTALKMKG